MNIEDKRVIGQKRIRTASTFGRHGVKKYDILMEAGEFKEAMEYADERATAGAELADDWLDRASKAHCKLIDRERDQLGKQLAKENGDDAPTHS